MKTTKNTAAAVFHFTIHGDEKFAFNAKDEADARSKVLGWLRYQGMMQSKNDIEIKVGPGSYENNIHNEWMA